VSEVQYIKIPATITGKLATAKMPKALSHLDLSHFHIHLLTGPDSDKTYPLDPFSRILSPILSPCKEKSLNILPISVD
jgi:hypothetical protein